MIFSLFVDIPSQIDINRLFLIRLGKLEMGYMCLFSYVSKCLQKCFGQLIPIVQKTTL